LVDKIGGLQSAILRLPLSSLKPINELTGKNTKNKRLLSKDAFKKQNGHPCVPVGRYLIRRS